MIPYKIDKLILDPESMVVRVITTKNDEYEFPIVPLPKDQKELIALIYYNEDKEWWEIRTKYYDSIKKGNYDISTILALFHEPTHLDERIICPWYSGFEFIHTKYDIDYLMSVISNIQDEDLRRAIVKSWYTQEKLGIGFTNLIEDILSAHVLATVEKYILINNKLKPIKITNPIKILQYLPTYNAIDSFVKVLKEVEKWIEIYSKHFEEYKESCNTFNEFAKLIGLFPKDSILAIPESGKILLFNLLSDDLIIKDAEYRISWMYYIHSFTDKIEKLNPRKLLNYLELTRYVVNDPLIKLRYDLEYIRLKLDEGFAEVMKTQNRVKIVIPAIKPFDIKRIITNYLSMKIEEDEQAHSIKFSCEKRKDGVYLVEIKKS